MPGAATSNNKPTPADFEREAKIALARTTLRFGQSAAARRAAMREIEELTAQRSPAMLAYLRARPGMA